MNRYRNLLFSLTFAIGLLGQTSMLRPAFKDFPVERIYHGAPAQPVLSKDQRAVRTRIRTGAKSTVEFAGHYTVPRFGCGAGCSSFYVADSISGRVYDGFSIVDLPGAWIETQKGEPPERIEFRKDSRLLRVNGCPNEHNCGHYDYEMVEGEGLRLIDKQLLPEKYQY